MTQSTPTKAGKGCVGIEAFRGKLRLRLPGEIFAGKQKYVSTGLEDTPENHKRAQTKAWQIEQDIITGNFDWTLEKYRPQSHLSLVKSVNEPQKALTLAELWDGYCEYRKPQVAETTFRKEYAFYGKVIKGIPIEDLERPQQILDYLLKTRPVGIVKRTIVQINACCRWALKSKLISENPFMGMAEQIKVAKNDREKIDPFSADERDAIIAAFEASHYYNYYAPLVKFLFMTGCRTGEAIALQWKHISGDCKNITFSETFNGHFKIRKDTKTHKARNFPCNDKLQTLLLSIRPDDFSSDDLVFPSPTGKEINAQNFTKRIWKGSKDSPGIVSRLVEQGKVQRYRCPYNTRHTFITLCLEAGVTLVQIAKWVGNTPEIIVKHYAGTTLQMQVPEL
ncbi:tyrosine-type recombinase/integrase [Microseira wollei]|uniref:Tyr recombinase domain-containing protein n=1 Tax=Microseira wollei NIES-4236 TaxID=2530354 RepID=A0AAV3XHS8_9CYAN|nr:tyrosine-type recombinase/integrase [Microseira wollei]GET42482.1 hypothetical protein MiSe_72990 [Microseira wollei NIES-4236]